LPFFPFLIFPACPRSAFPASLQPVSGAGRWRGGCPVSAGGPRRPLPSWRTF